MVFQILRGLRNTVCIKVSRRSADDTPLLAKASHAQRTIGNDTEAHCNIHPLTDNIDKAVGQQKFDGYRRVIEQKPVDLGGHHGSPQIDRRTDPNRPGQGLRAQADTGFEFLDLAQYQFRAFKKRAPLVGQANCPRRAL